MDWQRRRWCRLWRALASEATVTEAGGCPSAEAGAEGGEAVDVNVDMAAPATPEAPPA